MSTFVTITHYRRNGAFWESAIFRDPPQDMVWYPVLYGHVTDIDEWVVAITNPHSQAIRVLDINQQ